jgi:hypothetical protein
MFCDGDCRHSDACHIGRRAPEAPLPAS